MASVVGCEVEIQDVGDVHIQEVEIEQIPIEMPIETVETSGETVEVQPMIALQPLPEAISEEIVLQTTEEVVGESVQHFIYADNIPIPAPEVEVSTDDSVPSTSRKVKGGKKKAIRGKYIGETSLNELSLDPSAVGRKWEQKQVQIKTLEGEFSVTMWASGKYKSHVLFVMLFTHVFVEFVICLIGKHWRKIKEMRHNSRTADSRINRGHQTCAWQ